MQNLISADELRFALLKELYQAWQKRPGPLDYFPPQQIWDFVRKRYPATKIDGPLAEGVFNGLIDQKLIEMIQDGVRITAEGRKCYSDTKRRNMKHRLTLLGAVIGLITVIVLIVKFLIGLK